MCDESLVLIHFQFFKELQEMLWYAFEDGESQGRGNLVGCCLWGHTESDTTEVTQQQQQSTS